MMVKARAKINLALDVFEKRPDGYHEVEMVMQSIELHDCLEFTPVPEGITLLVENGDVPAARTIWSTGRLNLSALMPGSGAALRSASRKPSLWPPVWAAGRRTLRLPWQV